jgi:ABC-type glycerol-3-phosphate transport system substrate-binding protein
MHDLARRSAASLVGAVFLALLACSGGSDAPAPKVTITSVGWYEENIDPSFWTSAPLDGQTAFYDFFVHY